MRRLFYLLVALPFILVSCSTYAPVTNKSGTTLAAQLRADAFTILGTGEGTGCSSAVLGIPLGGVTGEENTYQTAVRKAVRSKQGDHFIQSTADRHQTFFLHPILYNETCTTVAGLVIKLK